MQCSLCNKVALRIVGKKGFCGTPMDVDGHYADSLVELRKNLASKILYQPPEQFTRNGRQGTRVHSDSRTSYFHK